MLSLPTVLLSSWFRVEELVSSRPWIYSRDLHLGLLSNVLERVFLVRLTLAWNFRVTAGCSELLDWVALRAAPVYAFQADACGEQLLAKLASGLGVPSSR